MKCFEIMKTNLECCALGDGVTRVAERMRERNIGFMPVCDEGGAAIGTITDRDLAIRVLADQRAPETTTAADVMTPGIVSCAPEDDLLVAEMQMSKYKVSRIVCVDEARRPVGVISLSDVAERETGLRASAVLRSVSQREARP